ncbi:hypothetical protein AMJ83_11490 [candidate division WOR_3 bacterium SM23_42]|uniref:Uncharacterized protein n=1 Tax=candidate division WOR_3 bacterium SM23_42 TaxID=1703779 RepID=A0A0S8FN70_UNCW3|nr:MAG: hypothetical protein AMJ83_11490 [candidate division WOR_3 bacterium SM23_42]
MIRPLKIGWLMCCFSAALLSLNPLFIEKASACGPCTDPHTGSWSGIGNGWCGRCGDRTYTFSSGSCANTDTSECTDYNKAATYTVPYDSEPVGSVAFAACVVALIAGGAAGLAALIAAFPVCASACAATVGVACVWCLIGAGAISAAVGCAFAECIEWCTSGTPYYSGSVASCS